MFSYIGAHLCELNTNPVNKVAHVMRLTFTRWCACPTDYMNKLEYMYVCLCRKLNGKKNDKTLIVLNIKIYITPENPYLIKVTINDVFAKL